MATITFQEYTEDFLGQAIALMSEEALTQARKGYAALTATVTTSAHPDAGLKVADLRGKVERFVRSASITIERNQNLDLALVRTFVARATAALQGRATKAALLDLIDLNSAASRHINAQRG